MNQYVTGAVIKELREKNNLTILVIQNSNKRKHIDFHINQKGRAAYFNFVAVHQKSRLN